jgi:hypothetical protein
MTTRRHAGVAEILQDTMQHLSVVAVIGALPISFAVSSKVKYGQVETCNIAKRWTMMVNPVPPEPTNRTDALLEQESDDA